jgi:ribosomal 50S subunit-recycling heat shock protein
MRLDKYLKVSRLMKRRTVANEACDTGRVMVNNKPARASYEVKPGDVIAVSLGTHAMRARVVSTDEYATKSDASSMYEILPEKGKAE